MKKLLTLLLVCGLIFTFAGCGDSKDKDNDKDKNQNKTDYFGDIEEDLDDATDKLNDSLNNDLNTGTNASANEIVEYIERFKDSDEYNQIVGSVESMGMKFELLARGDDLVYKYTYINPIEDSAAQLLQQSLESTRDTLKTSGDAVRKQAPKVDKVVFEYYSVEGKLLASVEV